MGKSVGSPCWSMGTHYIEKDGNVAYSVTCGSLGKIFLCNQWSLHSANYFPSCLGMCCPSLIFLTLSIVNYIVIHVIITISNLSSIKYMNENFNMKTVD